MRSHKGRTIVSLIILLFLIPSISIAIPTQAVTVQQRIRALLGRADPNLNLGIIVRNARTGEIIFSQRAHHLFTPASVQKLFTATAALKYLGPTFHFKTKLLTQGEIRNHTLHGNLTIQFSGDPELTTDDLNILIGRLKELGINKITGHVYIDHSDYGHIPYPPGWMWDDLSYGYTAPVDAIIINRNKFLLELVPAPKGTLKPKLYPILPANVVRLDNHVVTTSRHNKDCPLTIYSNLRNRYRIGGCLNRGWGRQRRTLALRDPFIYAKVLIQQGLQDKGITYPGTIRARKAPTDDVVLAEHRSPPLSMVLKEMLKKSDNLTADSLLKKIGEVYYKEPGTWQNGLFALRKILKPTKIDFKHNLINDGAGLSRYNLIAPRQLTQLLYYAYHHPTIRAVLLQDLPIGGKDGTLIDRLRPTANGEHVHAKTGSMSGVCALAGYVMTRHHVTLTFAIMANGFVGKDLPIIHLEDRICELLIRYKGHRHG